MPFLNCLIFKYECVFIFVEEPSQDPTILKKVQEILKCSLCRCCSTQGHASQVSQLVRKLTRRWDSDSSSIIIIQVTQLQCLNF